MFTGRSGKNRKSFHLTAALLVLLFFGTLVFAWLLFSQGWRPAGTVNHGELVTPIRPLDLMTLQPVSGASFDKGFLRGKWTLVYIDSSACGTVCRNNLYKMRQIRLAQGQDMVRVQLLFVLTDTSGLEALQPLLQEYPGIEVTTSKDNDLAAFIRQFDYGDVVARDAQGVYIVDPLGNFMMRYQPDARPKGMLEDLERLLKMSNIG